MGSFERRIAIDRLIALGVFQRRRGEEKIIEFTDAFKKYAATFIAGPEDSDDEHAMIARYGGQANNVLVAMDVLEHFIAGRLTERDNLVMMGEVVGDFFRGILNADKQDKAKEKYYSTGFEPQTLRLG